jgi:phospholipid/cholesterol/gamma-HCH transport system substrate-binding protein
MTRGDSRAGLLAFLAATMVVLTALIALARYPSLFRGGDEYRIVFRTVPGLSLGDEVRYGGLLVGSITSLELDPDDPTRILVRIRVRRETPVRTDTHAEINQIGLLGAPYLNLVPGSRNAPELEPGGAIPSVDNLSFQDAMSRLAQFLDRADTLLVGFERVASASPVDRMYAAFAGVDSLVSEMRAGANRVFNGFDSTSVQLAQLIDRTDILLQTIDTTIAAAGPELSDAQQEMRKTLRDMQLLVSELRTSTDHGRSVESIVRDLKTTSDNLARLTDRLERDPSSVLDRRRSPTKPVGPPPRD